MSKGRKIWLSLLAIIILAIFCLMVDLPKLPWDKAFFNWFSRQKIHLGLDLQGGTHLVYQADVSKIPVKDRASAIEGVRDVIERRVNAFGVSEPIVQTDKVGNQWRLIVELPGIKDVNQAIKMIGETPLLEFKEQNPNPQPKLTPQEKEEMEKYNQEAKKRAENVLKEALTPGSKFEELAKKYSEDEANRDKGGDLGWFGRGKMVKEFEEAVFDKMKKGEVYPKLVKTVFGYHIIKKIDEREKEENGKKVKEVKASHILIKTKSEADYLKQKDLWKYTGLTGKQLKRAQVEFDQTTGEPRVALEFNKEGKKLFAEITERNVGKPVAIFLDGSPISIPIVKEKISGGKAVITGKFDLKEAKKLAQRLQEGALPVPIKLISQQTIGPTLGKISLKKSLTAGLFGLLLIALFMIIYYRLPGLLAVIALCLYGGISLAIFKLIPVTLTLAGVAGFILSIGMAVDANVLIFERFKEEKKWGRSLDEAIEQGFKRAWPSIRDGNVSTLITCFILYYFGTSLIRGFGLTLGIGVLISMFSAIVVTRTFIRLVSRWSFLRKSNWLWGVKKIKVIENK